MLVNIEGIIGSYYYHVETEEMVMKLKPKDILRFDVSVTKRRTNNFWQGDAIGVPSTLLETSIPICCECFLENNQDFISSFLSDPRCSFYFIPEILDQISQMIVSQVQQLIEFPSEPECSDLECQELVLTLEIFLDVVEDDEEDIGEVENAIIIEEDIGEVENAIIIEESMHQDVSMIMTRASNEAISSLETFTDNNPLLLMKIENCNICMENFNHAEENEDNAKLVLSSMPCGHVFHHQCIVKWLTTSHTCPLCRYSMPTVKD